jgi:hypothetical protein
MIDTRLLGTWQSDCRKTLHEICQWRDISELQRKNAKRILGKVRVRFTRTRMYSEFFGEKSVAPYRVAAKDATSVAILTPAWWDEDEQEIVHVHFEGKYHWVWCPIGNFPEYFRRID